MDEVLRLFCLMMALIYHVHVSEWVGAWICTLCMDMHQMLT